MNVFIEVLPNFRREAKRLIKKYRSLKGELEELYKCLESAPYFGIKITENTYKIRLAVKSKGKGKSGGMRLITHVYVEIQEENIIVLLLSIYDKSDVENIPEKALTFLIESARKKMEEESSNNQKMDSKNLEEGEAKYDDSEE